MSLRLLFVTGKLAETALRRTLAELAPRAGFDYDVAVLPITVAALAATPWIARHLSVPDGVDRVVLPGLCAGDLAPVQALTAAPVERGPKDLRDLSDFFRAAPSSVDYGAYDIAILAEINHAPRLPCEDLLAQARALQAAGADVIDVGCDPGDAWAGVGDAVRRVRGEGMRVSIDSFNPTEVEAAVKAGAELVLSVNGGNVAAARSWGVEVVVLPDVLATLEGLDRTVEALTGWDVPFRIDPVIEPIGFGFAESLGRYLEVRRRYPGAAMMMGVGNLTELTDADSAAINVLLLGFCQELGVRSVLTTQVINWCRSCVRELDLARRLVHYACTRRRAAQAPRAGAGIAARPEIASSRSGGACRSGGARGRPQLSSVRGGGPAARHQPRDAPGGDRPVCALRRVAAARSGGSVARLLPRLGDGQGRHGADAGQELHAGSGAALGLPRCPGREPSG